MVGRTDAQFRLLLCKGVYLYGYKDSWEQFDETRLPLNQLSMNVSIILIYPMMIITML